MKHKLGNTPKCCECYFYREVEEKNIKYDGKCVNKKICSHDLVGHKLNKILEYRYVNWNDKCSEWEDLETRYTLYEVETRKPEPWRSEIEKIIIEEVLKCV